MPIDPVAENTIEDENDANFELDDLFKNQIIDQWPRCRLMLNS